MIFEWGTGGGSLTGDEPENTNEGNEGRKRFRKYRDDKIEIEIPSNWKFSYEDGMIKFTSIQYAAGGGALTGDDESQEDGYDRRRESDGDEGLRIKQRSEWEYRKEDFLNSYQNLDMLRSQPVSTFDGKIAAALIMRNPLDNYKMKAYYISDNGTAYILEYLALADKFNESRPDQIIGSFKIR
jgi:hypothetical protein